MIKAHEIKGTAVITGASKGIGKASAAYFRDRGWQVINLSRTASDLHQVKNILVDLEDVDFADKIKTPLTELIKEKTTIALVHNAAFHQNDTALDVDPQVFTRAFNINILAPSILNRLLIPYMDKGSSIIYIGSTLSSKAVANAFSYVTTKHATIGLMRATCQDLFGLGIHTACLCPGTTETQMFLEHTKDAPKKRAAFANMTSFGRLVYPEEIAALVYALVENPAVNGSVLHGNLGQKEY